MRCGSDYQQDNPQYEVKFSVNIVRKNQFGNKHKFLLYNRPVHVSNNLVKILPFEYVQNLQQEGSDWKPLPKDFMKTLRAKIKTVEKENIAAIESIGCIWSSKPIFRVDVGSSTNPDKINSTCLGLTKVYWMIFLMKNG